MKVTTLFSFLILSSVFSYKGTSATKKTEKRTVGILLFDNVEVLDFAGPFEVFSVSSQLFDHAFFDVKMIAKTKDPIIAVNGLSVNPDYSFADAPDLDILIIPGGNGAGAVVKDEEALKWVEQVIQKTELTMSVCTGAAILAKLGHLDNKSYCTHHTVYSFVQSLAPTAKPEKNKRFVQSNEKLYTSAGISAGIDLSFHIVEKLHGKEVTENTAMYMEYKGYK
ncbi:MAG: DJ-1/PfpI family protein [Bacteroidota bacterium]